MTDKQQEVLEITRDDVYVTMNRLEWEHGDLSKISGTDFANALFNTIAERQTKEANK